MSLHELELGVEKVLNDSGVGTLKNFVGKFPANLNHFCAAVSVQTTKANRVTMTRNPVYSLATSISVLVYVKKLDKEVRRRKTILPVIEAIILALAESNANGAAPKKLRFLSAKENTEEGDYLDGFIVWSINFETTLEIRIEDKDPEETLSIEDLFLKYYLEPGDDVPDLTDDLSNH